MKFNYAVDYIYINSEWFDGKKSLFKKLGEKTFFLYLTLFKFRIPRQKNYHVFVTSIDLLRKETRFSANEILEMLLKLKRYKIIKIDGYSRTEYFFDENKKIKDKNTIVIHADGSDNDWEYNIPVDLNMVQYYLDIGLNIKYIGLYCLLRRLSNNPERKAYMGIDKMAKILGYDKDVVNKMVYELNKRYLLYSWKVKVKKWDKSYSNKKHRFEHILCYDYDKLDKFKEEFGSEIEKNLSKIKVKMKDE